MIDGTGKTYGARPPRITRYRGAEALGWDRIMPTSMLTLDFETRIVVKRLHERGVCARTATFSLEEMRQMLRSYRFFALSDEDRGTKPRKYPLGKQPTVLTHGSGQGKKKRRK